MDAYNAGILYLRSQYGYHVSGLTCSAWDRQRNKSKEEREAIINDEKNYYLINNPVPKTDTENYKISLLLGQYNYGMAAKIELENALYQLKVSFDWEYSRP